MQEITTAQEAYAWMAQQQATGLVQPPPGLRDHLDSHVRLWRQGTWGYRVNWGQPYDQVVVRYGQGHAHWVGWDYLGWWGYPLAWVLTWGPALLQPGQYGTWYLAHLPLIGAIMVSELVILHVIGYYWQQQGQPLPLIRTKMTPKGTKQVRSRRGKGQTKWV